MSTLSLRAVVLAVVPFALATSACSAPVVAEGNVESTEDELRTSYADLSEALASEDSTTLTQALANDDPLNTRLPGKSTSLYDVLIGCL
jgi:hypothetical protein